ncbi:heme/hemin ABC transporter substrate-binding protein [Pleomorphovibrio marinus]|uniref:heme/hemin ABC transporter substrate-binding protein n=1 Tax=Pleomorphovibrio marinus TaxID=2164132 RepID=UPI000E0B59E6|nr:ABC transporter substrate-binding protein [Pleomorphovibrio marinus]
MNRYFEFLSLLLVLSTVQACGPDSSEKSEFSEDLLLVTAGGTITEIVHDLGFGDQIIATDITSTYPASMQNLPSIGYRNQIKAEGVLSLGADVILAEEGYLTTDVVEQLKASKITVHLFEKPGNVNETCGLIRELATYLAVESKGEVLVQEVQRDIEALEAFLENAIASPRMAFIMARGAETVFLAGEETSAEELFQMVGAENVSRGFKGFIPLTPEAMVTLNPDYLLLFESSMATLGGKQGLQEVRGISSTTAFQKDQILAMDGLYISGFGPRVGKAALELAKEIY